MEVKEFDRVLMKDGRIGTVVDATDPAHPLIDFGSSPKDWYTDYDVQLEDIDRVIH